MHFQCQFVGILLLLSSWASALPEWGSLAGLSNREIEEFARSIKPTGAHPAPGPDPDTHAKLVNDAAHPYRAAGPGDIRGPCPGLNTLASHGVSNFS